MLVHTSAQDTNRHHRSLQLSDIEQKLATMTSLLDADQISQVVIGQSTKQLGLQTIETVLLEGVSVFQHFNRLQPGTDLLNVGKQCLLRSERRWFGGTR